MSKFKVGDEIEFGKECPKWHGRHRIVKIEGSMVYFENDDWMANWYLEEFGKLLPAAPPASPWVPKVGDEVELLAFPSMFEYRKCHIGERHRIEVFRADPFEFEHGVQAAVGLIGVSGWWPVSAILPASAAPDHGDRGKPVWERETIGINIIGQNHPEPFNPADCGTTPTDRRMRDERVAAQKAEAERAEQRKTDLKELSGMENLGAEWITSEDDTDYIRLTGHKFEE